MARLSSLIIVVLVVLTLSFSGWLRGGSACAADSSAAADEVAKEARKAYVVGNLEQAISGFGHAYEMSGDASLLFDLAEAQREAGHPVDALRSYQNYLRRAPAGMYRQNAERQIRDLKKSRASATKDPGPAPPGSKIGAAAKTAVGSSSAGTATITNKDNNTTTNTGSAPAATRSYAPPPAAAAAESSVPAPARTRTPTPTPAPTPVLALAPAPVGPGANSPEAAERPGVDLTTSMPDVSPIPPRRWTVPRWLPIALGVLTVALGTTAIVSGLSASNRYDDLLKTCGPTGCSNDQIDSVKSRARLANIFWASTGVAAAGFGTTLYFHLRGNDAPTGATGTP